MDDDDLLGDMEDDDPDEKVGFMCCCQKSNIPHNETLKFKLMGKVDFNKTFLFENRFDGHLQQLHEKNLNF